MLSSRLRVELSLEVQGQGRNFDPFKCRADDIIERFESQLREAVAKAPGGTVVVSRVSIRNLPVSASGADKLRHWLAESNVASTVVCLDLQGIYSGMDRHDGDGTRASSESSEPKQGYSLLVLQHILQAFAGHKKLTHLSIPHNAIGPMVIGISDFVRGCPISVLNLHDSGLSPECAPVLNSFVQALSSTLTAIDLVRNNEICPRNDGDAPAPPPFLC